MKKYPCGCEFQPLPAMIFGAVLEEGWEVFGGTPICQTKPCEHHAKYRWNVFHADGSPMEREEQDARCGGAEMNLRKHDEAVVLAEQEAARLLTELYKKAQDDNVAQYFWYAARKAAAVAAVAVARAYLEEQDQ